MDRAEAMRVGADKDWAPTLQVDTGRGDQRSGSPEARTLRHRRRRDWRGHRRRRRAAFFRLMALQPAENRGDQVRGELGREGGILAEGARFRCLEEVVGIRQDDDLDVGVAPSRRAAASGGAFCAASTWVSLPPKMARTGTSVCAQSAAGS